MKISDMRSTLAILNCLLILSNPIYPETISCKVVNVAEGDTLEILRGEKIEKLRLAGIDCPDEGQPFSVQAKQATAGMTLGKFVSIDLKSVNGNIPHTGIVTLSYGINLNRELLRAGLAWCIKDPVADESYLQAESEARSARRGLWGETNPTPPWKWRQINNPLPKQHETSHTISSQKLTQSAEPPKGPNFKGIYIGQPASTLPEKLKKSFSSYEGMLEGVFIRVWISDGTVTQFSIIYQGKSESDTIIYNPITLQKAIIEHSLWSTNQPKFALARGQFDQIWGLIDLENAISYTTLGPIASNIAVTRVDYLNKEAPVLNAPMNDRISTLFTQMLLSGSIDKKTVPNDLMIIPPDSRYVLPTRDEALSKLTDQADTAIGRGKKTIVLLDQAEIWLGVNEKHSEAKEIFAQLCQFHRDFKNDFETLLRLYDANKDKFKDNDILTMAEPIELDKKIKRRLVQLKAMGFSELSSLY